jgi:predicted nucleotidyltransferase
MDEYGSVAPLLGRSRIRRHILVLLVDEPTRRLHLRAIARTVGTSAGTAARELGHLERAGLVTRTPEGAQVYYQANAESPMLEPVREIVRKSIGAANVLRRALTGVAGIERALVFGSYARGDTRVDSDIDLLVIGTPDRDDLTDRLEVAGREIGRHVNEVVMSASELEERRARGDRFIASIEAGASIAVLP